jgi:hypothetical protein
MGGDIAKPQPRDIMLIPAVLPPNVFTPAEAQVFNQNRAWSGQWKVKLPGERGTVEIGTRASLATIVAAFGRAAAQARGREVILFAGHGADASISSLNQAAFDLGPEPGLMNTHTNVITDEVTKLDDVAQRVNGKFVPKRVVRPDGTIITPANQAAIDLLAPRFEALEQIGKALRDAGVAQLRLLTCDVGLEPAFADRIARITGMRLVCYLQLVQTAQVDFQVPGKPNFSKIEIFVGPDGATPPPVKDPSAFSKDADFHGQPEFSEIPQQQSTTRTPPAPPTP